MARPKTLPDHAVFAALRHVLAHEGEKAVSFGRMAAETGLAAASLVQRYGTRAGMIRAALIAAWDGAEAAATRAAAHCDTIPAFLKALGGEAGGGGLPLLVMDLRDATLRARAEAWRAQVEAELTRRLRDRDAAAMLFAAWQGQMLWQGAGGKGFRLKDAVKRLG